MGKETNVIDFDTDRNVKFNSVKPPAASDGTEKKWTAEEVADQARVIMKSYGWEDSLLKEEKPVVAEEKKPKSYPDDVKPEPVAAVAKAEPEPESEKEAPAPKVTKSQKQQQLDDSLAEKIGERIAKENEKLISRIAPTPAQKPEDKQESIYSAENMQLREVFETMAKKFPGNEELPAKFEEFVKKEQVYIAEWNKDHPGETYDPNEAANAEWTEENQPDYDARKFARAEAEVETNRIMATREAEINQRNAFRSAIENSERSIESSAEAFEADIKSHLVGIVGENSLLDSEGPISEKFQSESESLARKIQIAAVLMTPGTGVEFDPNTAEHAAVQKDLLEFDADISKLSKEDQAQLVATALGKKSKLLAKTYAPADKYRAMSDGDRARHWNVLVEPTIAAKLMTVKSKVKVSMWIDRIYNQVGKKLETRTGWESGHSPSDATQASPNSGTVKPRPPSISNGSSGVTPQSVGKTKSDSSWESLAFS